jgi:hypothetical protein
MEIPAAAKGADSSWTRLPELSESGDVGRRVQRKGRELRHTESIGMRVNLEDTPSLVGYLNRFCTR